MAGKSSETFLRLCMALAVIGMAGSMLLAGAAFCEPEDQLRPAMAFLKAETAKLGAPEIKGEEAVAGKSAPALFFGDTKMNNNFALVDKVQEEMGATATLFVNSGDEFIRVATNVKKADGSRAIGTNLDPKGKAIAAIKANEAYYGEADILGKAYVTGYEPLRDPAGKVIGVYYVGYPKGD
jgi:hypothetical protein